MTAHPCLHDEALDAYLRARPCGVSLMGSSILVLAICHEPPSEMKFTARSSQKIDLPGPENFGLISLPFRLLHLKP